MILKGTEVRTIEEAFALLPQEEKDHALRVAAYTDAAFARAAAKNLYIEEVRGKTELIRENRSFAREAGLYHDIGKLCEGLPLPGDFWRVIDSEPAEGEAAPERPAQADHTAWGAYLLWQLYPRFRSQKTYHQRILVDAARDHHERSDGSGAPLRKEGKAIGYLGRMVALADELDHRAMLRRSEDPIGDVLLDLKAEAAQGKFDPEFVKCFSGAVVSLRTVFNSCRGQTKAIPRTETWIERRPSRPMELRYRLCTCRADGKQVWLAEMGFRNTKGELLPYSDMKGLLNSRRLGPKVGDYFLYELCDALRRFEVCGEKTVEGAIELPEGWFGRKSLMKALGQILKDEDLPPDRLHLLEPEGLREAPTRTLEQNLSECAEAGYVFRKAEDLLAEERGPARTEDEIALAAIAAGNEAAG